jgi:hypothetical protein
MTSQSDALEVQRTILDMTSHQTKKRGVPATRAYTTRRDWLAFIKEVTKLYFNPLMPNKSGGFTKIFTNLLIFNFII